MEKSHKQTIELPLGKTPIKSFVRWVHTLSIICQRADTEEWLLNNFINLSCTTWYGKKQMQAGSEEQMVLDFWRGGHPEMLGNNPFLQSRTLGYDGTRLGLNASSIVDVALEALDNTTYPLLYVDESVLPYSTGYHTRSFFPHRVLIHGASYQDRTFKIYAFGRGSRQDEYGRLGSFVISFDDLRFAAQSMELAINSGKTIDILSVFCQLLPSSRVNPAYELSLSQDVIIASLQDYLSCRVPAPVNGFRAGFYVFGADVFRELEAYFRCVTRNEISDHCRRDLRHVQVLEEHHALMASRINKLSRLGIATEASHLQNIARDIARLASAIRILKMKLIATTNWRGRGDFTGFSEKIRDYGIESRVLMEQALTAIKRHY